MNLTWSIWKDKVVFHLSHFLFCFILNKPEWLKVEIDFVAQQQITILLLESMNCLHGSKILLSSYFDNRQGKWCYARNIFIFLLDRIITIQLSKCISFQGNNTVGDCIECSSEMSLTSRSLADLPELLSYIFALKLSAVTEAVICVSALQSGLWWQWIWGCWAGGPSQAEKNGLVETQVQRFQDLQNPALETEECHGTTQFWLLLRWEMALCQTRTWSPVKAESMSLVCHSKEEPHAGLCRLRRVILTSNQHLQGCTWVSNSPVIIR